ncbi:hypothetical protein J21TS3_11720 [Paenibacillus cookii]|uniref:Uncharacterized protein n=1 Tax=Paenibacillus cookii TaxID=157839 RepID=A0ABQ4LSV3_9BACL|nr:hypothetical protein J21TS3_11720 [Paenibacillus cookii]
MKETNYTEPEQFIVRLASLGAVWQQGVIPQVQTTRWTGGYDLEKTDGTPARLCMESWFQGEMKRCKTTVGFAN